MDMPSAMAEIKKGDRRVQPHRMAAGGVVPARTSASPTARGCARAGTQKNDRLDKRVPAVPWHMPHTRGYTHVRIHAYTHVCTHV